MPGIEGVGLQRQQLHSGQCGDGSSCAHTTPLPWQGRHTPSMTSDAVEVVVIEVPGRHPVPSQTGHRWGVAISLRQWAVRQCSWGCWAPAAGAERQVPHVQVGSARGRCESRWPLSERTLDF
jgi:hypothetical protein